MWYQEVGLEGATAFTGRWHARVAISKGGVRQLFTGLGLIIVRN
jgi:hypothetical protein